jgi:LPXTG-motif cell wall-anchored protein
MFSLLSANPGTEPGKYLDELISYSEEPFTAYLKNLNLVTTKAKTPGDLILYLIRNKDKGLYPENAIFDALARMIADKDLPADKITSQIVTGKKPSLFIIWVILGAGLIFFFIIFWKRRKKKEKE